MKSYCVFCKTGSEHKIAKNINQIDEKITAIAPVRIIQQKRKGVWVKCEQILLPGYIFIFTDEEMQPGLRSKVANIYKILEYQFGLRELAGDDYEYSMWIYRNQGSIAPSRVLTEGSTVRVLDGPLSDGFGTIVKLDRHKRKVWIEFEFDGQKRTVSLSAECVTAEDEA